MRKISEYALRTALAAVVLASALVLGGCVDQHPDGEAIVVDTASVQTMLEITDPVEKEAVFTAKAKVSSMQTEPRIIATSAATADICARLELPLVGVCSTTLSSLPEQYQELPKVGTAMSPDMEIVSSLSPDWILSPSSLQSDL